MGKGRPVVIVGGAFSTRSNGLPLARALAAVGSQGVVVDRRGRGDSGDTGPHDPGREADDLAVVAALGDDAALLGHSSGAVLALLAASRGAPVAHLLLSEPPFRSAAAERLADSMPSAELLVVPESLDHGVDPAGTAREAAARLRR